MLNYRICESANVTGSVAKRCGILVYTTQNWSEYMLNDFFQDF